MTENKRFVITKSNFIEDGWFIDDTVGNFSFGTTKDKSSLVMYEKQLNELHDKNKQLRKENYEFLDEIASLNEVQIPNISKKISDLEYENEQLKQQLKNEGYDDTFETRIIHSVVEDICYLIDVRIHNVLPKRYHQANMFNAASNELKNLKKDIRRSCE